MALATVLILTSRETRRDLLVAMLQKAGYAAAWMQDPSRLPTLAVEDTPDAVLADLASLDKGTVDELLRHCRELRVPVLAVVGEDGFSGHPAGDKVDDFLLEPVRPLELEARVQRLLRRSRGREGRQVIRAGELMIDQERYEVNLAGRRVLLTIKD
ncbi:MAG: response regulator transcription factor [Chloroflexi bacterium]|nr:response regulator transcription factor [Chloroflexota bacterium]